MLNTPVLFIIFNRPDTTKEVFAAIRNVKPSRLFIAADAPRIDKPHDIEKCKAARSITENIDWPCEVKRLYQEVNLGCSYGPRAAFDWFFSHESEGIILEDDCLPHPDFFVFAAAMLERYRTDERIISINGSNLGYQLKNGYSYTYSRFMNMWGWATWADRAKEIDYSLKSWKSIKNPLFFLYRHMRQHLFDTDINWYKYWKEKFDLTVNNENITWWDWQWVYHQLTHRKLSIVPAVNLVSNIGFNTDATHTHEENNPAANIPVQPMPLPLQHSPQMKPNLVFEEQYVKWVWCYHKRLPAVFYFKQFISRLIGRS
jgi:hypothetical protein